MPPAGDRDRIAQKLATYFVSDTPPPALVQRMAQTFQKTDGDIAAVLTTMVHAPEFTASLKSGAKFKDSVHYVFSAVRMAYDDKVILNTNPIQNWLNRLAEGLFNRADAGRLSADLGDLERPRPDDGAVRDRPPDRLRIVGPVQARRAQSADQPAFPLIPNALYFGSLRQTLSPTTRPR